MQVSEESRSEKESSRPVLLVEDNLVNQKVASILLQQLGLEVEYALNGKEAVAAVGQKKYSVILMDCHMPEMDGFQATIAIRKLEAISGTYTPIIAVTALAMTGDRERCISVGMDDYISKPINKDILKIKLNHWLQTDVVYKSYKLARKYLRPYIDTTKGDNPLNLDELEEFYGLEELNQVLSLFITHTEDMVKRIQFYLKECNADAAAGLAHELKASAASIGAKQLARHCLFLEQTVGQQDWKEAEETMTSFLLTFEHIKRFIHSAVAANDPVGR